MRQLRAWIIRLFATLHIEPSKPLTYDYPSLYDPAKRKAFKAAWRAKD